MPKGVAPKRYTMQEKERGLLMLIREGGNYTRASEQLERIGGKIPAQTLRWWRENHWEIYDRLAEQQAPFLAQRAAADAEEIASQLADLERQVVEKIRLAMPDYHRGDLPKVLSSVTNSKTAQYDKMASPLRGRPTTIVEHRDSDDVLNSIAARNPGLIVEGSAEEIPPAQIEAA